MLLERLHKTSGTVNNGPLNSLGTVSYLLALDKASRLLPDRPISLNTSPNLTQKPDLAEQVRETLPRHGEGAQAIIHVAALQPISTAEQRKRGTKMKAAQPKGLVTMLTAPISVRAMRALAFHYRVHSSMLVLYVRSNLKCSATQ